MARLPNRWDRVLDAKPIATQTWLLDETAKLFAKDLAKWPLEVEDWEGAAGAKLQAMLAEVPAWPGMPVFTEAFRLARWDLDHAHDAYDDYVRHDRWVEKGLAPTSKGLLLFLSRLVTEQLLALSEATHGRVDRIARLAVLDRTERNLQALVTSSQA